MPICPGSPSHRESLLGKLLCDSSVTCSGSTPNEWYAFEWNGRLLLCTFVRLRCRIQTTFICNEGHFS